MVSNLSLRLIIIFFTLIIYVFTLGCARSLLPHMSLLWLRQVGATLVVVCRLLIVGASLAVQHWLWDAWASDTAACRL